MARRGRTCPHDRGDGAEVDVDRADEGRATFASMWSATVARTPDAPFLLFADDARTSSWTYAAFDRAVAGSARLLASCGVGPGDPVHLALRNSPAFVAITRPAG